ncbi:competence family protein [Rickettsia hoogstraalii str. RCCE3]|nr:competence family protein [Rickettsia hoogstraalii str. RCCE3]
MASNIYSSFLASIITAPVVINQFFIFSTYSVPANLIVVLITSFFLMPLALLSLPFTMIGFDSYILMIMGFFIEIIIRSANYFNNLQGAVWYFGYITNFSILLFLFGFFLDLYMENFVAFAWSCNYDNIFYIYVLLSKAGINI